MKLDAHTLRVVYDMWERSTTTKQVDDWLRTALIKAEAGGGRRAVHLRIPSG